MTTEILGGAAAAQAFKMFSSFLLEKKRDDAHKSGGPLEGGVGKKSGGMDMLAGMMSNPLLSRLMFLAMSEGVKLLQRQRGDNLPHPNDIGTQPYPMGPMPTGMPPPG